MSSLPDREKLSLLQIARRALTAAVEHRPDSGEAPPAPAGAAPVEAFGAFVTLHCRGRLRGCIGQLDVPLPLPEVVAHCARAAALEDPRFRSIEPQELRDTDIEISVLSAPEEIAPDAIVTGQHGLIITRGEQRGLLLPQVATEHKLSAPQFLEETCQKAGLPRDAWKRPGTRIEGFTAEVFSEKEFKTKNAATIG